MTQACLNGGTCITNADTKKTYCSCRFPFGGPRCEKDLAIIIPGFGQNGQQSYLGVSGLLERGLVDTVVIEVKPLSDNGLIFLMTQTPSGFFDFIGLFLVDGQLVYKFDLGSGTVTITSPLPIPLGVYSMIELRRNGMMGELVINNVVVATGTSPGTSNQLDVMNHFYLGGVSHPDNITHPGITQLTGFRGCIRAVALDAQEVDLGADAFEGVNIVNCFEDVCMSNPCQNGGTCTNLGLMVTDFECLCPPGISGRMCEIVNPCEASMPCMHGGQCHVDSNATVGYRCVCTATHIGPQCETPVGNTTVDYAYAGDSYIIWNSNKADLTSMTLISFQVYVNQDRSNGLLIVCIRPSLDYLAIVLDDGFVKVIIDLGGGEFQVTSNSRLTANQYFTITVNRNLRNVDLTVSGDSTVSNTAPGSLSQLNVDNHLYVGGVPQDVAAILPVSLRGVPGFMGCIDEVSVNGQFLNASDLFGSFNALHCNVDLCDPSPCENGGTCTATGNSVTCICPPMFGGSTCGDNPCDSTNCFSGATCFVVDGEAVCACPHGKGGEQCELDVTLNVLSFQDALRSYMVFPKLVPMDQAVTTVDVAIKPTQSEGLILYAGFLATAPFRDFISLGLNDGFVEFRYNLGSGTAEIKSPERVELYRWHTIRAQRSNREGNLTVDDGVPAVGMSLGSSTQLNVLLDTYLGGHRDYSMVSPDAGLTSGFTGCINNGRINTQLFNFPSAIDSQGVTECADHPCERLVCLNGGTCTDLDGMGNYGCVCALGFKGDDCGTMIINNCSIGNDMCSAGSDCVFDYSTETYECFCPLTPNPRAGQFCEDIINFNVAKFQGNSFASYRHTPSLRSTKISFNMSAESTNGLVFYLPPGSVLGDFLAIGIIDGNVELRYDLGTGVAIIRNSVDVGGGHGISSWPWHYVTVERTDRNATLTVDGVASRGSSPGSSVGLNLASGTRMFVGGIDVDSADLSEYNMILDGDFNMGLNGCIADLLVNGELIDLDNAEEGENVISCDPYFG
jgi:hypothetical protein